MGRGKKGFGRDFQNSGGGGSFSYLKSLQRGPVPRCQIWKRYVRQCRHEVFFIATGYDRLFPKSPTIKTGKAMPRIVRLATGFPPRWLRFDPGSDHVEFMVEKRHWDFLRFLLPIFIPPAVPNASAIRGRYSSGGIPSGFRLTPSPTN
jgi:hypothetical protein